MLKSSMIFPRSEANSSNKYWYLEYETESDQLEE